jgi:hypothetical protein
MMMEVLLSSETSVLIRATRRNISEEDIIQLATFSKEMSGIFIPLIRPAFW